MRNNQSYKPLRLALFATLMCATFASCSNTEDDITPSSTTEGKVPLSVSAIIQSGDGSRKAGLDAETFEVGDTIGLYILDSADNAYNESSDSYNVPAVYNGTNFDLTQDVYLTDSDAYIYAYYPYSSVTSGNEAVIDISSGTTDVLATESASTANRYFPQVTLSFSHSLARVTLSVKVSEEIGEATLTSASLCPEASHGCSEVTFFKEITQIEGISYFRYVTCTAVLSSTESTDIDILIHPTTVEGAVAALVIDDKTYEFDIPTSLAETWAAGGQYTYPITITKAAATEDTTDVTELLGEYKVYSEVLFVYISSPYVYVGETLTITTNADDSSLIDVTYINDAWGTFSITGATVSDNGDGTCSIEGSGVAALQSHSSTSEYDLELTATWADGSSEFIFSLPDVMGGTTVSVYEGTAPASYYIAEGGSVTYSATVSADLGDGVEEGDISLTVTLPDETTVTVTIDEQEITLGENTYTIGSVEIDGVEVTTSDYVTFTLSEISFTAPLDSVSYTWTLSGTINNDTGDTDIIVYLASVSE